MLIQKQNFQRAVLTENILTKLSKSSDEIFFNNFQLFLPFLAINSNEIKCLWLLFMKFIFRFQQDQKSFYTRSISKSKKATDFFLFLPHSPKSLFKHAKGLGEEEKE